MEKIEVTENDVKAAFDVAKTKEVKDVLEALFCKRPSQKPNIGEYTSIKTYEDACEALREEQIDEELLLSSGIDSHHIALIKLETISRSLWGNDFQPKPDAKGSTCFYYPWFALYTEQEIDNLDIEDRGALLSATANSGANAGFGYLYTINRSSDAYAYYGFRLCQETQEKATYFGKQFIELWAQYIAFNFTTGEHIK